MSEKKNGLALFGVIAGGLAAAAGAASLYNNHKKSKQDPDEVELHDWYHDTGDDETEE